LKVNDENSQRHGSVDPDPYQNVIQVLLTYEVRGLGELVQHLNPQIHGLVVHTSQLRGQLHLVNAERDTLNIDKKAQFSYNINNKYRNCVVLYQLVRYPPRPLAVARSPRATRDRGTGSWRTWTSSFHTPALLIITREKSVEKKKKKGYEKKRRKK
jgi:hypothetical protein